MAEPSETVRDLNSLRSKHGPASAIGCRCSNLIEQIWSFQEAETVPQRIALAAFAADQRAHLARLIAGNRQAGEG